jgi:hypothetical protein
VGASIVSTSDVRFPFSIELREQHAALRSTLHWMEVEMAEKGAHAFGERSFLELLRTWRGHLGQHFHFEEENGFEGAFGSPDPEIQELTGTLVRQHRALEARLDALLDRMDAPPGAEDAGLLRDELLLFFRQLRRHDALEDAMLQRIVHGPQDL